MQRTLVTRFLNDRAKLLGSNMGLPERLVTPIIHFGGWEWTTRNIPPSVLKREF